MERRSVAEHQRQKNWRNVLLFHIRLEEKGETQKWRKEWWLTGLVELQANVHPASTDAADLAHELDHARDVELLFACKEERTGHFYAMPSTER